MSRQPTQKELESAKAYRQKKPTVKEVLSYECWYNSCKIEMEGKIDKILQETQELCWPFRDLYEPMKSILRKHLSPKE